MTQKCPTPISDSTRAWLGGASETKAIFGDPNSLTVHYRQLFFRVRKNHEDTNMWFVKLLTVFKINAYCIVWASAAIIH